MASLGLVQTVLTASLDLVEVLLNGVLDVVEAHAGLLSANRALSYEGYSGFNGEPEYDARKNLLLESPGARPQW